MPLFAVHLSDGFLPLDWCVLGYVLAVALAALGCWRLTDRDIPLVALMTAALFVASSIKFHIPPSSVHVVLNGLVGVMLGQRAGLAIFVGLFLQAVMMGHGGLTTLGVNVVVQVLPALAVGMTFRLMRNSFRQYLPVVGGLLSAAAVMAAVGLQSLCVLASTSAAPAFAWFAVHVPVAVVEGIVTGFMVQFLSRVKPELLGLPRAEISTSLPPEDGRMG